MKIKKMCLFLENSKGSESEFAKIETNFEDGLTIEEAMGKVEGIEVITETKSPIKAKYVLDVPTSKKIQQNGNDNCFVFACDYLSKEDELMLSTFKLVYYDEENQKLISFWIPNPKMQEEKPHQGIEYQEISLKEGKAIKGDVDNAKDMNEELINIYLKFRRDFFEEHDFLEKMHVYGM